jgi:hypothetical protein
LKHPTPESPTAQSGQSPEHPATPSEPSALEQLNAAGHTFGDGALVGEMVGRHFLTLIIIVIPFPEHRWFPLPMRTRGGSLSSWLVIDRDGTAAKKSRGQTQVETIFIASSPAWTGEWRNCC